MEEKTIEGYPDYSVTDDGRVFSHKKGERKELKPWDDQVGYLVVDLKKRKGEIKKRYCPKVHRLVAQAFIPNAENKKEVNHIDGDKYHNNKSNLEWCTRLQNMRHLYQVLGYKNKEGIDNKLCKPIIQKDLSGNKIKEYFSLTEAKKQTGVNNIHAAMNGIRNHAGGFKWEYKESVNV